MTKRNHLKLFFSIFTIIFICLSIINIVDNYYFHPPLTDYFSWKTDPQTKQLYFESISKDFNPEQTGVQSGDILISINGKQLQNQEEIQTYLGDFNLGDKLAYAIKRQEQTITVYHTLKKQAGYLPFILISALIGLLFLQVGLLVVLKKPFMRTARLFYLFCFTFFLTIGFNSSWMPNHLKLLFMTFQLIGIVLWAPTILYFFMNFPAKVPLLHKHPNIVVLIYLPSLLATIFTLFLYPELKYIFDILVFVYIGLAFLNLLKSRVKIKNPHEKKSLQLILWGLILGLFPLGCLVIMSDLIISRFGLTAVIIIYSCMIFVPLTFGYSIMRYGLMDVDIIIKKSLIYSILSTAIILLYFLLVVGLGGYIVRKFGISSNAANLLFLSIVALFFQPIRNRIQTTIDRKFYRDRYEYQKTLLSLSQSLPGLVKIQDILKRVSETISDAMHVSKVMIHLYDKESQTYINQLSIGIEEKNEEFSWQESPKGLVEIIKNEKNCCIFYKIEEDNRYNELPVADKVKIEKLGIVLVVPMFYQNSMIGFINLGQKQSGQAYNREDMDLLQTLAANTAIALINGRLHQENLQKQRLENELILAKHIQTRLFPEKDPQYPGLEIAGMSKPATLVGGDYYDYIPISDNRLFIFVGDVSGKGMAAALYMSKVQGMIQVASGIYKSPLRILSDINRHLYAKMERNFFVTMLGALVDVKSKRITLCRAGHMPAYIRRNNELEKVHGKGIGLGLEAGNIFDREIQEVQFKLNQGDYCLFYSDGLVEAMNSNNETFGEKRLEKILANGNFNSAAELKDVLLDEVKAFQNSTPQNDDITFVILKAEG